MEKLLFGISGLPLGNEGDKFTYATGIEYLRSEERRVGKEC